MEVELEIPRAGVKPMQQRTEATPRMAHKSMVEEVGRLTKGDPAGRRNPVEAQVRGYPLEPKVEGAKTELAS